MSNTIRNKLTIIHFPNNQKKTSNENWLSADYLKKIKTKSWCAKQFSLKTVGKIAKALKIDVKDLFNKLD